MPRPHLNIPTWSGTYLPWVPVTTIEAAAFLKVHPKTLLKWKRSGIGPAALPYEEYIGKGFLWLPGKLLEWWEARHAPSPRLYQQICSEWTPESPEQVTLGLTYVLPPKPLMRQLRRRRRDKKRYLRLQKKNSVLCV